MDDAKKVEEIKELENLPISDEQDIETNDNSAEDADDEFIEVVGDTDEVINEIEEEMK